MSHCIHNIKVSHNHIIYIFCWFFCSVLLFLIIFLFILLFHGDLQFKTSIVWDLLGAIRNEIWNNCEYVGGAQLNSVDKLRDQSMNLWATFLALIYCVNLFVRIMFNAWIKVLGCAEGWLVAHHVEFSDHRRHIIFIVIVRLASG